MRIAEIPAEKAVTAKSFISPLLYFFLKQNKKVQKRSRVLPNLLDRRVTCSRFWVGVDSILVLRGGATAAPPSAPSRFSKRDFSTTNSGYTIKLLLQVHPILQHQRKLRDKTNGYRSCTRSTSRVVLPSRCLTSKKWTVESHLSEEFQFSNSVALKTLQQ